MNHSIPERKDTDPRFHWHIEDYFKTDADWEAAYSALEASIPEIAAFSGKLAESAETLLSCLQKNETLSLKLDHVYTYANMRMHEDSANAFYQGLAQGKTKRQSLLDAQNAIKSMGYKEGKYWAPFILLDGMK